MRLITHWLITVIWCIAVLISNPDQSLAAFGEDVEKPKPEFIKGTDKISAKLIPRGKSTTVTIDFECSDGKLVDVKAMDFGLAERPEVDRKNFKSELFTIEIGDVPKDKEITVSISSDFFSSSTQFYVFNEKLSTPWIKDVAQNVVQTGRIRSLLIHVTDGGPFDSDGAVNGTIFLVGGPFDSFWGYALGTLFIRFFGIFLVLGFLMCGMMLSGAFFQYLDKKQPSEKPIAMEQESTQKPEELIKEGVDSQTAAAIAVALHLHFQEQHRSSQVNLSSGGISNWIVQGRSRMMASRSISVQRIK